MNKKIITRVAPSPTGVMHLGTLRTALLNYLFARSNNGEFILRIDDTDQERGSENLIDYIYQKMSDFKLDYDFTFKQSQRLDRYKELAEKIADKILDDGTHILNMGDYEMTILRSNGFPLYNFASTVDDYDYGITHIIRGVDHISNASKQKEIWNRLNKSLNENKSFPELIHAGLLLDGVTGKKLSKRDGSGLIEDYSEYNNKAILNWILKLGWSSKEPTFDKQYPTLDVSEMIELFNSGNINQANTKVFINKLQWLDKKWKQKI